jgi:hypothetical protein
MSGALFPKPLMRELQKEGCGGAGICIVLAGHVAAELS